MAANRRDPKEVAVWEIDDETEEVTRMRTDTLRRD